MLPISRRLPRSPRRAASLLAALAALATACGGDDDSGIDGSAGDPIDAAPGSPDAAAGSFVLTSTAFTEGGEIPLRHTCQQNGGDDLSPPLTWTGGPEAASYALVLTDRSNRLVHSILWDIPGDATALPENIEKVAEPAVPAGAKQSLAFDGTTRGYRGPCPPEEHTYEFALYALPDNPLPGVTLDTSRADLVDAFTDRALQTTTLTGRFAPPE